MAKRQEYTERVALGSVSDSAALRRIRSEDLFAGATRVLIEHQDSIGNLKGAAHIMRDYKKNTFSISATAH